MKKKKTEYQMLESHFKHLSNTQKFEYQDQDWMALQAQLDKDDSDNRSLFISKTFGLLAILCIGAGLIFTFTVLKSKNEVPKYTTTTTIKNEPIKNVLQSNTIDIIEDNIQEDSEPLEVNHDIFNNDFTSTEEPLINKNLSSPIAKNIEYTNETKHANYNSTTIASTEQSPTKITNNSVRNHNQQHVPTSKESDNVNKKINLSKRKLPISTGPILIEDKADEEAFLAQIQDKMEVKEILINKNNRARFFYNINAGIETAQTPNGNRSDSDINLGLRIGTVVSSKVILNAGLNYVSECYIADGTDYTPPQNFWSSTNGRAPESISALCNMLDFSIGASYHFTEINKNGLVANINLSSNYMLREEYNYRFANSDEDWNSLFEGENQTLLSNIELGTSYKFNIGEQLYLDAGPYIKIPIQGIGHGNVKLNTIGFRLGISIIK
jgi:hypothetical protein